MQGGRGSSDGGRTSFKLATQFEKDDSQFNEELLSAQQKLLKDFKVVAELRSGGYFGEHACLRGALRTASVVSVKYSETLSLTKAALDGVAAMFPKGSENAVNTDEVCHGDTPMHEGVAYGREKHCINKASFQTVSHPAIMLAGVQGASWKA